jgi:hypothetical protein
MNKQTDYSNPWCNGLYPDALPINASMWLAQTMLLVKYGYRGHLGTVLGTNRALPNREPYFFSTCLVGLDLDAFEGVSSKIRSGRYLGTNSIFLEIQNAKFNTIDMTYTSRSVNITIGCLHDAWSNTMTAHRIVAIHAQLVVDGIWSTTSAIALPW